MEFSCLNLTIIDAYDWLVEYKSKLNSMFEKNGEYCSSIINTIASRPIGKGGSGQIYKLKLKDSNEFEYVIKQSTENDEKNINIFFSVKFKNSKNVNNSLEYSDDEEKIALIYHSLLTEYVMSNIMSTFYINGMSINFFCTYSIANCESKILNIIPKFEGDINILYNYSSPKKRDLKYFFPRTDMDFFENSKDDILFKEYNILFCIMCILHSLLLMSLIKMNHNDIKSENILLQKIENATLPIRCNSDLTNSEIKYAKVTDYKYIIINFGNNRRVKFETSKLKYIPKITDWAVSFIWLDEYKIGREGIYKGEFFHPVKYTTNKIGPSNEFSPYYDLFLLMSTIGNPLVLSDNYNNIYELFDIWFFGQSNMLRNIFSRTFIPSTVPELKDKTVNNFINYIFENDTIFIKKFKVSDETLLDNNILEVCKNPYIIFDETLN